MSAPDVGAKLYFVRDPHHVAAVFEDDGDTMVVLKHWGPRKQRWFYKVEPLYIVERHYRKKPEAKT